MFANHENKQETKYKAIKNKNTAIVTLIKFIKNLVMMLLQRIIINQIISQFNSLFMAKGFISKECLFCWW